MKPSENVLSIVFDLERDGRNLLPEFIEGFLLFDGFLLKSTSNMAEPIELCFIIKPNLFFDTFTFVSITRMFSLSHRNL